LTSLRDQPYKSHNQGRIISHETPQCGHVVLIKDDRLKRGEWLTGIIESIMQSSDNHDRSARVRLSSGNTINRSLGHLYPFELFPDYEEQEHRERAQINTIENPNPDNDQPATKQTPRRSERLATKVPMDHTEDKSDNPPTVVGMWNIRPPLELRNWTQNKPINEAAMTSTDHTDADDESEDISRTLKPQQYNTTPSNTNLGKIYPMPRQLAHRDIFSSYEPILMSYDIDKAFVKIDRNTLTSPEKPEVTILIQQPSLTDYPTPQRNTDSQEPPMSWTIPAPPITRNLNRRVINPVWKLLTILASTASVLLATLLIILILLPGSSACEETIPKGARIISEQVTVIYSEQCLSSGRVIWMDKKNGELCSAIVNCGSHHLIANGTCAPKCMSCPLWSTACLLSWGGSSLVTTKTQEIILNDLRPSEICSTLPGNPKCATTPLNNAFTQIQTMDGFKHLIDHFKLRISEHRMETPHCVSDPKITTTSLTSVKYTGTNRYCKEESCSQAASKYCFYHQIKIKKNYQ
jgi:hypothetical protein